MRKYKNRIKGGTDGRNTGEKANETTLRHLGSPEHVHALMEKLGWEQKITTPVLTAAFDLAGNALCHDSLVNETREFFRARALLVPNGIETLPACWLKALPSLLLRTLKPHWSHVPYMITELRLDNGVLCLAFAQEMENPENRFTRWDELRVTINRCLRPNFWRPLDPQEQRELLERRPNLRNDLFPQANCSDDTNAEADL